MGQLIHIPMSFETRSKIQQHLFLDIKLICIGLDLFDRICLLSNLKKIELDLHPFELDTKDAIWGLDIESIQYQCSMSGRWGRILQAMVDIDREAGYRVYRAI